MINKKKLTIALAGNPNCGKSTISNNLTGSRQHVGNYPGVTVEKKEGNVVYKDFNFMVVDLPGTYSLSAYSEDEVVAGLHCKRKARCCCAYRRCFKY